MADFAFCDLMPRGFVWRPAIDVRNGPKPISGPGQVGAYAAGFHWLCEYTGHVLNTKAQFEAWYAMLAGLLSSSPVLNVRFPQHARTLGMAGTLNANVAINATTLNFNLSAGPPPVAGQWFSMIGASTYARLHMIRTVGAPTGSVYPLTFVPDLREAYTATQVIVFGSPVCSMILAPGGEADAWPDVRLPMRANPSIRFEEYWADV